MRRTVFLSVVVLLCVIALGADSPKEYDGKTEVAGIGGVWRLTREQYNGNNVNSSLHETLTYYKGTLTADLGEGKVISGTCCIDSTCNPPQLDWFPIRGATIMFIYKIDGDTLRIASKPGAGGGRPQGFNDKGVFISIYKRVK